jgi:hypothetical protein
MSVPIAELRRRAQINAGLLGKSVAQVVNDAVYFGGLTDSQADQILESEDAR